MKFLESAEGSSVDRLVRGGKKALRGTLVAARFALPSFDIHSPPVVPLEHMVPSGITTPFDGSPLGDYSDDLGHYEKGHSEGVRSIEGRRPHGRGGERTAISRVVFTPELKRGRPHRWIVSPGSDDTAPSGAWHGGDDERNEKNTARSFSEPGGHAKTIAQGLASLAKDDWGQDTPSGLARLKHDLRGFDGLSADDQRRTFNKFIHTLPSFPPAPDGWQPVASSAEEKKQLDLALTVLAEVGLAVGATSLLYQLGKNRRKAVPVLVALASLVAACGGSVSETATALFPGGQQATEQAPSSTPTHSPITPLGSPSPDASATTGPSGFGGGYQTCEAAAETFLAPRISKDGAKVPGESMVQHSPDPNKWTANEKLALVDSNGQSIAPLLDDLKDQIAAINPSVHAVAVWSSSEGYVLELQINGKEVWAVARNGLPQYRPDLLVDTITGVSEGDTDEFRLIPDPPVDGDKKYVVTGGCGVLGVFDKKSGNMVAMYKPLTNEWVMLTGDNAVQEAFGTPATPVATEQLATITPFPSETPAPTATPVELLGGDKTSVVFAISYGSGFVYDIPKEVQPSLIPTTPEQWNALTMPTRADGTKVPWGELITLKVSDSVSYVVIPVLIKAVVEKKDPTPNVNGTIILPVYEIPAKGGSNFIIPWLQKNGYSTSVNNSIYTLKDGIPALWQNGTILDVPTYKAAVQSRAVNEGDNGAELRKHVGEVVLILFPRGDYEEWNNALTKISTGELASSSGSINQNAEPGSLILP